MKSITVFLIGLILSYQALSENTGNSSESALWQANQALKEQIVSLNAKMVVLEKRNEASEGQVKSLTESIQKLAAELAKTRTQLTARIDATDHRTRNMRSDPDGTILKADNGGGWFHMQNGNYQVCLTNPPNPGAGIFPPVRCF